MQVMMEVNIYFEDIVAHCNTNYVKIIRFLVIL